jgi:hypothetical protein
VSSFMRIVFPGLQFMIMVFGKIRMQQFDTRRADTVAGIGLPEEDLHSGPFSCFAWILDGLFQHVEFLL